MGFLIPAHATRRADDPIFALNAEASRRASAGEHIVNASIGVLLDDDGRLALLPSMLEALRDTPPEVCAAYAPICGNPAFLDAVKDDFFRKHPEARSCAILVATPGGSGALSHAIGNFLEPGQALLTTSLYWNPYATMAETHGRALETFRMFDHRGRFDAVDFADQLSLHVQKQGRALALLNSPCHNPTGYSLDDSEWAEVADAIAAASKRGPTTLLVDVAYASYQQELLDTCLERVLPLAGEALVLFAWSASKAFAQYGSRTGAIIAVHPDVQVRERVHAALSFSSRGTWSTCHSAPMAAIARILQNPVLRARVESERQALKDLLDGRIAAWNEHATRAQLSYPRYDGGFFTTVFCENADLAASRLRRAGVMVVPLGNAIRIALSAVAARDVPDLVAKIAASI